MDLNGVPSTQHDSDDEIALFSLFKAKVGIYKSKIGETNQLEWPNVQEEFHAKIVNSHIHSYIRYEVENSFMYILLQRKSWTLILAENNILLGSNSSPHTLENNLSKHFISNGKDNIQKRTLIFAILFLFSEEVVNMDGLSLRDIILLLLQVKAILIPIAVKPQDHLLTISCSLGVLHIQSPWTW